MRYQERKERGGEVNRNKKEDRDMIMDGKKGGGTSIYLGTYLLGALPVEAGAERCSVPNHPCRLPAGGVSE